MTQKYWKILMQIFKKVIKNHEKIAEICKILYNLQITNKKIKILIQNKINYNKHQFKIPTH